jgi:hypothetical protein
MFVQGVNCYESSRSANTWVHFWYRSSVLMTMRSSLRRRRYRLYCLMVFLYVDNGCSYKASIAMKVPVLPTPALNNQIKYWHRKLYFLTFGFNLFIDSMCSVDKNICCSGTDGHIKSRYLQMTGSKTCMQYIVNIGSSD